MKNKLRPFALLASNFSFKKIIRHGILVFIALCFAFNLFYLSVRAQDDSEEPDGRYRIIEEQYKRYTWQLLSLFDGRSLCEIIVGYEGFPADEDVFSNCGNEISSDFISLEDRLINISWELISEDVLVREKKIAFMGMMLDIVAPERRASYPYVILTAVEPLLEYDIIAIYGLNNNKPFECMGAVCMLQLIGDTHIEYWAISSFGDESEHYSATIRISENPPYYFTQITERSDIFLEGQELSDSIWGIVARGGLPQWVSGVESIIDLRTNRDLAYLAGKLLQNGIVDAGECEEGGLEANLMPNECGLEVSKSAVEQWQNQFDPLIWGASRATGVPSRLLKTFIEQETQFWPGSGISLDGSAVYGFGQLDEFMAGKALRWNDALVQQVCDGLQMTCNNTYARLTTSEQADLRMGLVQFMDADCSTCEFGINMDKSQASIVLLAQVLNAYARQTADLMSQKNQVAAYDDLWKFAFVAYHSNPNDLADAVGRVIDRGRSMKWDNLTRYLEDSSIEYVDNIWEGMLSVETQILLPFAEPTPVLAVTPTVIVIPTSTSEAFPSMASTAGTIRVVVYIDQNDNGVQDENEAVDDLAVEITFEDGGGERQTTENGEAAFQFEEQIIGSDIFISFPWLYRSYYAQIPYTGLLRIVFKLNQPELPVLLP